MKRVSFLFVFFFCLSFLSACGDSAYLLQCVTGQWSLMSRARPIDDILAEETEPQEVRDRLAEVVLLREFAVDSLHLPDTGSYRKYADLERPYAVWNLVAAPELSLKLNEWCFPVVGCVTYRGYFDESEALTVAEKLSAFGFDVDVSGIQAYSTLNWFDDPVLNTFLNSDSISLAALLFHEMTHQIIYIPGDTEFNESFAKTVEREGVRRWLQSSGSDALWNQFLQREARSADFNRLLMRLRNELRQVYESNLGNDKKRAAKKEFIAQALDDYEMLKKEWNGYGGFDPWMYGGLNNARLSAVANYYDLVPAFESLLRQVDNDLKNFYAEVKILGSLPKEERLEKMKLLSPRLIANLNE
jgi:predicted aminopeptidase